MNVPKKPAAERSGSRIRTVVRRELLDLDAGQLVVGEVKDFGLKSGELTPWKVYQYIGLQYASSTPAKQL